MKHVIPILAFAVGLLSCNEKTEKPVEAKPIAENVKFHKLNKLFVIGDFDGDGKIDTISQHTYSRLTKTEMDSVVELNDWGAYLNWFQGQDADMYLAMNKKSTDTLHWRIAEGLYCLINLGDNNSDGKDEIALVVDYLDYSRLNSCKIYTLCKHKWMLLQQFNIFEGAFDYTGKETPVFNEIPEFLEKQNGKWFYKDYLEEDHHKKIEDVGKMQLLKLNRCE